MAEPTFFWHDYETFGRRPRRDRPAQFAGVRTDLNLNEIEAPVMCYCRPAPDFLPDPQSCLLTGIVPQSCLDQGIAETAFADTIEAELARPATIAVGYNSVRFDSEVTRHLFWRCLLDPYACEWQDGCSRWDLLDVVRAAWSLRPEGLTWPLVDGRASFRLEQLTAANGLTHTAAHDALSDVRATIDLARLIRTHQPRLWDFCLKLRDKDAVRHEIGAARPFVHLSGMYAVEHGCLAIVWPLAAHPANRNEIIVWDLAHDPAPLAAMTAQDIRLRLFTRADALPDGVHRLPIKSVHVNRSPVVFGNLRALGSAAERWAVDIERALRHAEAARALTPQLAGLWADVYARPAPEHAPDVDENLYGGFIGSADRAQLRRLRTLAPQALAERRPAFDDQRLAELLFRYRARNFPHTLDAPDQARWLQHRVDRLVHGHGADFTLATFADRLDELTPDTDQRGLAILGALRDYARDIAPEPISIDP